MESMKKIPVGALNFDRLPDAALIGTSTLSVVMSKSRTTLWRMEREGKLPKSRKLGGGHNLWSVGEIRALLSQGQ